MKSLSSVPVERSAIFQRLALFASSKSFQIQAVRVDIIRANCILLSAVTGTGSMSVAKPARQFGHAMQI